MFEIEDRKLKILNIIIENYLNTGVPVGSRTISKYPNLNVSSATVRNEMADLEELGYIMQPHTSAGRIPTDKGYRLYVNKILEDKISDINIREEEIVKKEKALELKNDLLIDRVDRVEKLLGNLAVALANNTNYATLITAPSIKNNKIKFLQLSKIENRKVVLVCVLDANIIKNQIIELDEEIDSNDVFKINMILNTNLNGEVVDEIKMTQLMNIKEQAGNLENVIMTIMEALSKSILKDDDLEIYSGGTTNILKYPELSDAANISGLLTELVEKQEIAEFMSNRSVNENEIEIYIGDENRVSTMKNCSVVTMNYELKDGLKSTIGIIGPKRMDYQKVINHLEEVKDQLDIIFKEDGK